MFSSKKIRLVKLLTYAGALPFLGSTICLLIPLETTDIRFMSSTYGVIILSFLCGIHWAVSLFFDERAPRYLLLLSNIVTLIAWGSLLLPSYQLLLCLHSFCFMFLLALDKNLFYLMIYPAWFYELRRNITGIVIFFLTLQVVFS